jgi:hyperosmotically inducible periplasmic protein
MKKLLLFGLGLALSAGAVAQTAQPPHMAVGSQAPPANEPVITSDGPVVADYGKHPAPSSDATEEHIAKEVRHELLMLPYYSLFDDLEYSVQGRTVTLNGSVTSVHGETRQDAERAAKQIEGVEKVVNNIQVLSPSPFDDEARERVYRSLARSGGLSRYFWQAAPSIHIIVDHQRVTLKGYVNSEGDKNLANIAANEVRDVFTVVNDLQVVK